MLFKLGHSFSVCYLELGWREYHDFSIAQKYSILSDELNCDMFTVHTKKNSSARKVEMTINSNLKNVIPCWDTSTANTIILIGTYVHVKILYCYIIYGVLIIQIMQVVSNRLAIGKVYKEICMHYHVKLIKKKRTNNNPSHTAVVNKLSITRP